MNYHRRTTRPDATFYRDQRKVPRTSSRGGRGGQGVSPVAIVIALAILAAAAFVMLRH